MRGVDKRARKGAPFVVGIGSSGPAAGEHVAAALDLLARHPHLHVRAQSRFYANPATGGGTHARFLNGAVVVETALTPDALLMELRAIELVVGRVRARKNGPRALDLDVLLGPTVLASPRAPTLPHPRMLLRAFATVPAVEALTKAELPVPDDVRRAAQRSLGRATLLVDDGGEHARVKASAPRW